MKNIIKKYVYKLTPQFVYEIRKEQILKRRMEDWVKAGGQIPPPHFIKQIIIANYQKKYKYKILIETGTYLGSMVEAQKNRFKTIISIELGVELFNNAKKRFENDSNVQIINGDSGKILPKILENIDEPAIFWLDGHYSEGVTAKGEKECPIFEELDAIFNSKKHNHVLLIDDARYFNGKGDYPTIEKLKKYIQSKNKLYKIEEKYDIIRCTL